MKCNTQSNTYSAGCRDSKDGIKRKKLAEEPFLSDIYAYSDEKIDKDEVRLNSLNILANCAAKELSLLHMQRGTGSTQSLQILDKENIEAQEHTSSDIDSEINVSFPLVMLNGKKVFKCTFPECRKIFPSLSRMRRHYIIHTGAKPFKCLNAECPKSFSRRDNMIQHHKGHCIYTKRP